MTILSKTVNKCRSHTFRFVTLVVSLITLVFTPLNAEPLVVGLGDDQAAPFVLRDDQNRITGGIVKELMDEFGRRMNVEIQYLSVPRKRQEPALLSGQIHVFPLANPVWYQYSEQYRWSPPVIADADIFLQHSQNKFPLKRFDDLAGKRLGTLRGYHYEGLMDDFEAGTVTRDDGTTLKQNLERLAAGRIDVLIGSKLQLLYLLSLRPDAEQFHPAELTASIHYRRAAFTPEAPISISEAYFTLQEMEREGVIEQILGHYR